MTQKRETRINFYTGSDTDEIKRKLDAIGNAIGESALDNRGNISYAAVLRHLIDERYEKLCPECRSDNVGYVPMSKVLVRTRKCLECGHEWEA